MNANELSKNYNIALLLLRLGVAAVFIYHGWGKITGIEGVQQFFGNVGIPLPGIMAWVVGITEFVGGIMVLTGFKIKIPSILLAIIMVVAILTVKMGQGFEAARVDILLLMMTSSLALMGSGSYSLDSMMGSKD
ncbi:MAG: DoxX family protein [Balneolaceae bacterium]|nr:DoxX family protein [Balneolaceae bacterium]